MNDRKKIGKKIVVIRLPMAYCFDQKRAKKKNSVMDRIGNIRWKGRGKLFTYARRCGIGHMADRRVPETYNINDKMRW